ncbi:tetratricopeptide repeat protein [Leptospira andrefontaineae]|uniref:Tetratricopeptide repeat protein n=1 Tax=Leptospira andrefontaineae TaxID=2484976 RepID=A0A4R9H836_9LEPT|nr:tetratricopeptide repeat protein [Leptospira andrefontaineae]TGK42180.1 tetratricopeptide repeat protein [Leptospira andrefontaineae]
MRQYHSFSWPIRFTKIVFFIIFSLCLSAGEIFSEEISRPEHEKADRFIENQDYKSALKILLEYEKKKPDDDVLLFKIGFSYFRLEEDQKALTYFEKAIRSNSKEAKYYDYYGATLYFSGKIDEAEKQFLKCIELDPKAQKALSMLGAIYAEKRQPAKAKNYFLKALEIDPEDLRANYSLAGLYFNEGELANSQKYFEICYKLDPENYATVSYLIENLYRQEKFDEAEKYKKRLAHIRNSSQDPRISNLKYFRFDTFPIKEYMIVAQESFSKTGDLYYYYVFSVFDKSGKHLKNINLESSTILKEQGLKYIIGMDNIEEGNSKHSTSNVAYPELPTYFELKSLLAEILEGKINFPYSSSANPKSK